MSHTVFKAKKMPIRKKSFGGSTSECDVESLVDIRYVRSRVETQSSVTLSHVEIALATWRMCINLKPSVTLSTKTQRHTRMYYSLLRQIGACFLMASSYLYF